MAKITIIDDDLAMDLLVENLRYSGHDVKRFASAIEAIETIQAIVESDLVILDVIMELPVECQTTQLSGARTAGLEVYRSIRIHQKNLPIIFYSVARDGFILDLIQQDSNAKYFWKMEGHKLKDLIQAINNTLKIGTPPPQVFIVHGQNNELKLELKNYLQNILKFPEPIILHEQPSLGRTIIDKFEDYALRSSIVFSLLTPDDIGASAIDADDLKRRGRQNVISETGYFLGLLGRKSGRVILLYKGPLELPSDLAGVVYIDVSNGIATAGEEIRKELINAIR